MWNRPVELYREMVHIDMEDEPAVFYNPRRVEAKLLWFGNGYLEYRFSNASLKKNTLRKLEISAEVCAEDHEYNNGLSVRYHRMGQ